MYTTQSTTFLSDNTTGLWVLFIKFTLNRMNKSFQSAKRHFLVAISSPLDNVCVKREKTFSIFLLLPIRFSKALQFQPIDRAHHSSSLTDRWASARTISSRRDVRLLRSVLSCSAFYKLVGVESMPSTTLSQSQTSSTQWFNFNSLSYFVFPHCKQTNHDPINFSIWALHGYRYVLCCELEFFSCFAIFVAESFCVICNSNKNPTSSELSLFAKHFTSVRFLSLLI